MPVDERTSRPCEPVDILNGGASLALAETVAGYGSIPLCEPGQMPCGIQISANHVHMVPIGTYVEAVGKILYTEDVLHTYGNVDITTPEGKLVSTARIVNLIVKKAIMNLPGTTIHKLIDNLTRSPFSFALYRLPWTDEPILVFTGRRRCRSTKQPRQL